MSDSTLNWESRIDHVVAGLEAPLVETRRYLHAHPEPSGQEFETSKYIARRLEEAGLVPRIYRDGLGVAADVTLGRPASDAPLIAIRADIDALKMADEKTVEYASRHSGVAHACGHDAHTAIALGAAWTGAALRREFSNGDSQFGMRLRFIFQPAEETSQGAAWLVEQGVLEGVDAILALHVDPERKAGQVGIRYGVLTANCDEVDLLIEGHGGHGARPHHTIDPVAAAAQLINALYQLLPRSVDSRDPSVFSIGQINGGYAANVIPERVVLRGSLRTIHAASRETVVRRISEIARGVGEATRATITASFRSPLKAVHNDARVTAVLEDVARRVVGSENVALIDRPSMGGEDFSVYLEHVPGTMLRLGCAPPELASPPFLHSSHFDLDERALVLGTRILVRTAARLSDQFRSR